MRVLFPVSLTRSPTFQPIYDRVKTDLEEAKIKAVMTYGDADTLPIIKWQRECMSSWDPVDRKFKMHPNNEVRIEAEPSILLYIQAKELTTIERLLEKVTAARRSSSGANVQVFVLVDGLKQFKKRDKQDDNQAFRARLDGRPEPAKRNTGPSAEDIEMALMRLQLIEKCHVLQPKDSNEVVRWLTELTKDMGARRKRCVLSGELNRHLSCERTE
jgi:peroxiredoxin family protein